MDQDRGRRAARWALLPLAALLLYPGILSFLGRASALHGEDGVLWGEETGSLVAVQVDTGGPGHGAGIQRGDRILDLDDRAVRSGRELRDYLWGRGGIPTRYRLESPDGSPRTIRLVPEARGEESRVFYYLWLVGLLSLGAGVVVLHQLPGHPGSLPLFGLGLALYLVLAFSPSGRGGWFDWLLYGGDLAGRLLAPPLLAHLILVLSARDPRRARRHRAPALLYVPAALLLALTVYLIPLRGALGFADPEGVMLWKDRIELLYLGVSISGVAALLAARFWTATRARTRWRLRWLALSAAAGLLPFSLLYLIPIALDVPPGVTGELSVLPIALVPLGFTAAVFQDRAVDLDRTLRRAVFGVLAGSLFLGAGFLISRALGWLAQGTGSFTTGILAPAAGAGICLLLLARPLRSWSARILGAQPAELSRALLEFRDELEGEIRLEPLAEQFARKLRARFRVDPVILFVREGDGSSFLPVTGEGLVPTIPISLGGKDCRALARQEMLLLEDYAIGLPPPLLTVFRKTGAAYLFPLAIRGKLTGLLAAGPPEDGSPLDSRRIDVLAALALQAAKSLEAARLVREIEARMAEERRLRAVSQGILEGAPVGMLLADASGRILSANRAAVEILGRDDLGGRALAEALPRGILLLLDRRRSRAVGGGREDRVYRFSFGAADGVKRVVNVTRAPLAGEAGSGWIYALDDVTEEASREEKMLRQDHLASMGLLASQVAHEVNTPLTGIASYTQMLMTRLASRLPEMDLLRKIEAQAFRAAGIAGSVLNFARRRDQEVPETFEPVAMAAECLALFQPHVRGKGIRVVTRHDASLPTARGHRSRVQQVVMNLLLNAAQALPEGGEVRLELAGDGTSLKIRVGDNGVGIQPGVLPRIFEPFFTTRSEGTGLGLAVVRRILDEHNGTITVESEPGKGSTFTVTLPAAEETVRQDALGA